jgi:hypothetical protein
MQLAEIGHCLRTEAHKMAENVELEKSLKAVIYREIWALPPLLPVKFGSGFLLQYVVRK